jgi:hypothetical protein
MYLFLLFSPPVYAEALGLTDLSHKVLTICPHKCGNSKNTIPLSAPNSGAAAQHM